MRNRIWIPEKPITHELERGEFSPPTLTVKFGGYFYVDLIDAKTGRVKEHYEFPNLLTDTGMDWVGGQAGISTLFAYLGVGTDNTTPNTGDTTLGAEVSRTNSDGGFTSEQTSGYVTGSGGPLDSPYYYQRRVRLFTEAQGNGNLTELGWFNQSSGGTMGVRSLFKDSGGSPITVTKTSSDQLKVTYEWRMYPPVTVTTGSIALSKTATSHSYTASALDIDNDNYWGITDGMTVDMLLLYRAYAVASASQVISPTGSESNFLGGSSFIPADDNTVQSYSAGTFYLDLESTWNAATANFGSGGIPGFGLATADSSNRRQWQVYVSESIKKTNLDQLKLNWRITWDRAVITS